MKRQATVYLGLFISISLEAAKKVVIYRPENIQYHSDIVVWLSKSLWKQKLNIKEEKIVNIWTAKYKWAYMPNNINKLICRIVGV